MIFDALLLVFVSASTILGRLSSIFRVSLVSIHFCYIIVAPNPQLPFDRFLVIVVPHKLFTHVLYEPSSTQINMLTSPVHCTYIIGDIMTTRISETTYQKKVGSFQGLLNRLDFLE